MSKGFFVRIIYNCCPEKIIDIFPYPIIGKIKGKPDCKQIKKIKKKIQENAASV